MYYVIDAVNWSPSGHVSKVRWHRVDADEGGLREGRIEEVPVVDATEVCKSAEVRVYVSGSSSSTFFRMKACPEGIDAEIDDPAKPLRERMSHLPTF